MTDALEPALPWDILREIAFICPRGTCATLMRTCAFLNHEAAASILSHKIRLFGEYSTVDFLKFLRAGKKSRYPCARHLAFCFDRRLKHAFQLPPYDPMLSPDSANALAHAIALMTGLVVVDYGLSTVEQWPAIGDAIVSLPSLQTIMIQRPGPPTWQLLRSLKSTQIRSIILGWFQETPTQHPSAVLHSLHPVQAFGSWTSTLTELEYLYPYVPPAHDASAGFPEVYPMMRALSIRHRASRVDPIPYIRAFPNLAYMSVIVTMGGQSSDDVYEHEHYRTLNVCSQRELQRLRPASQHSGW